MKSAIAFTAILVCLVLGFGILSGILVKDFSQKQSTLREERQGLEEVLKKNLVEEEKTQGEFLLRLSKDSIPPNSYVEYMRGKKSFPEIFTYIQQEIAGRANQLENEVELIGRSVSKKEWLIDTLMCDRRLLTHEQLIEYRNFYFSLYTVKDICAEQSDLAPCTGSDYRPVWGACR